ncbi:MAG: hypothetical protein JSU86_14310 [Phycisphaerales bacterium]|nr:MAG: hypothetical protein JSU86_14310 [Phycisphaerales bacterium]
MEQALSSVVPFLSDCGDDVIPKEGPRLDDKTGGVVGLKRTSTATADFPAVNRAALLSGLGGGHDGLT